MNKKLLYATLLSCTAFCSAQAQKKGFYIGPRFMVGSANSDYASSKNMSTRLLLGGGVHAGYQILPVCAIETEVIYVNKGAKERGVKSSYFGSKETYTIDYKLSYIELPFLFKLNLPIREVCLKAYAGPSFNFNTNSKYSLKFDRSTENDIENAPLTDIESTETAAVYGLGIDIIPAEGGIYSLDFRISSGGRAGIIHSKEFINRYYTVSVGVAF